MRSERLYNAEKLHVSEVYYVVDGKQINIEDKVEWFRKLERAKKLFCHCGCCENVVLVADPKNVRRQHFRLLSDCTGHRCEYEEEGYPKLTKPGSGVAYSSVNCTGVELADIYEKMTRRIELM